MIQQNCLVVGTGWGAHAARALARDDRVRLQAIVARGSPRSRLLAAELGVELVTSLDEGLERFVPDIVVLAVGEHEHEALALAALAAGAHLLCTHPVAPSAAAVERIARAAEAAGRIARTDYTFRVRPELRTLASGSGRGALIRVAIDAPGRWLPIVLDLAVSLAGPVSRILAASHLPAALEARAREVPAAFPPSLLLEHHSGAVTSFASFPHARPGLPVDVRTSWERAQVRASLPAGGATLVALNRGGIVEERTLVAAHADATSPALIIEAMHEVTRQFVSGVLGQQDGLATLFEEAHLRAVWSAVWRAVRTRDPVQWVGGC